jgi:hypothetical protein
MLGLGDSLKLGKFVVNDAAKTFNPADMDLQVGWTEKGLKYDIKLQTLEGEALNPSEENLETFFGISKRLLEGVKAAEAGVAVLNHELTYDIHGDVEGGTWEDMENRLFPESVKLEGYETSTRTGGFVFKRAEKEVVRIYLERSFTVEKGVYLRFVFTALGDIEVADAVAAWRRAVTSVFKQLAIEIR